MIGHTRLDPLPPAPVGRHVGHIEDDVHGDPLRAVELRDLCGLALRLAVEANVVVARLARRALGRIEQGAREESELRGGQRPVDHDGERNAAVLYAGPVVDGSARALSWGWSQLKPSS